MNVVAFTITTVPDIDGGQKIHQLQGLDDKSTSKALFHMRQQKTGSRKLPLYMQKIAAISVVYRGMGSDMGQALSVKSLGDENSTEAELLNQFFNDIDERSPTLVSWDGTGFDLPVIHYRSLKNKVVAPGYWEVGDNNHSFRQDNTLSRYHDRHTDLRDVLSSYNESEGAPLNDIALMLGYPGSSIMDDDQVWNEFMQGNVNVIRQYAESKVLNSYLVYLRFQLIRGLISEEQFAQEQTLLKETLENSEQTHLNDFANAWKNS